MRTSTLYKLGGPRTLRRSSSKIFPEGSKKNVGWGGNLQNIEKMLRIIYQADGFKKDIAGRCKYWLETGDLTVFNEEELLKLKVILQRDQSGAEALIVGYDTTSGDYRKLFINNIKIHTYTAAKLFEDKWVSKAEEHRVLLTKEDIKEINRTPIEQLRSLPNWKALDGLIKKSDNWAQHERYYFLSKKIVHAYNNGLSSPPSLRRYILEGSEGKVVISKSDSIKFLQFYGQLFPELNERASRYRSIIDKGLPTTIYNLFGFPFTITTENVTEKLYRDVQTWPQQSTVGEITRIAFSELQYWIEDNHRDWDILLDCHDSYCIQCPLIDVKDCTSKSEEFMNIELTSLVDGTKFRMKSECQVGFNMAPYKKEGVNELGLRELNWI